MLACDDPRAFAELLPGFIPKSPCAGGQGEVGPIGPTFPADLRHALLGDKGEKWVGFYAPPDFRGDFWTAWYLAGRAERSQYDALREVIAVNAGLPGHVACLALRGSGFHGQGNRGWVAEYGNLHLSLGLKCDLPASECGVALTMLPAVAVADALHALGLPERGAGAPGIKWVNDILIQGRKLGGVLTSARSQNGRFRSAVLGIGLNVLAVPEVAPTTFTPRVTCLGEHISLGTKGFSRVTGAVLRAVAERFEQLSTEGGAPLLAAYRDFSTVLGQDVAIHETGDGGGGTRRGRVLEIRPDLALVLSDGLGPVTRGRLALEETSG